jgi:hypothetical protein
MEINRRTFNSIETIFTTLDLINSCLSRYTMYKVYTDIIGAGFAPGDRLYLAEITYRVNLPRHPDFPVFNFTLHLFDGECGFELHNFNFSFSNEESKQFKKIFKDGIFEDMKNEINEIKESYYSKLESLVTI